MIQHFLDVMKYMKVDLHNFVFKTKVILSTYSRVKSLIFRYYQYVIKNVLNLSKNMGMFLKTAMVYEKI